jgi:HAD superfamily hydrolase (TIGR01490 family)
MAVMERPSEIEVVAAFDFDGTLSTRDNFVPFLRRFAGTPATTRAFATVGVEVGRRGRASWKRDEVKAALLRQLVTGRDVADLDDTARRFARDVLARHLRREAVARAEWHRDQGHRLVIVSASLGAYLRPIANELGFDAVLATELEVGDDGRLTGRMAGNNVRGAEKARVLDAWLEAGSDGTPFVWAYGDSSGDRELWARADRAVRLGRRAHRGTE